MVSIFKNCKNCGKQLGQDATWRKKFCSDKCRVAFHRTSSAQALYAEAIQPISKLGKKVSSGEKQLAIETLKVLRRAIDDQLRVLGDVDTQDRYELMANNRPKKIYCKACGQTRFDVPARDEKCSFCGQVDWNFDKYQQFLNQDPTKYD